MIVDSSILDLSVPYGKRLRAFKSLLSTIRNSPSDNSVLLFASTAKTLSSLLHVPETDGEKQFEDYFRLHASQQLTSLLSSGCGDLSSHLHYLLPPVLQRLQRDVHGNIVEQAEEVRLSCLNLFSSLINAILHHGTNAPSLLSPYISMSALVFCSLLQDPMPDIRLLSPSVMTLFMYTLSPHRLSNAEMGPGYVDEDGLYEGNVLAQFAEPLINSINKGLKIKGHQKCRRSLLNGLLYLVIAGGHSVAHLWSDFLFEFIKDDSFHVRLEIVNVCSRLLLSIPNWRDFCGEMISIILIGINDDVLEVRNVAQKCLICLGERYSVMFPNICKDKENFANELFFDQISSIDHPIIQILEVIPSSSWLFVRSFLNNIIEYLSNLVVNWTINSRLSGVKGLLSCILIGNSLCVGHISLILNSLLLIFNEEDQQLVTGSEMVTFLIAKLIEPMIVLDSICKLSKGNLFSNNIRFLNIIIRNTEFKVVLFNSFCEFFFHNFDNSSIDATLSDLYSDLLLSLTNVSVILSSQANVTDLKGSLSKILNSVLLTGQIFGVNPTITTILNSFKSNFSSVLIEIGSIISEELVSLNNFKSKCPQLSALIRLIELVPESVIDHLDSLLNLIFDRFSRDVKQIPQEEEENEGKLRFELLCIINSLCSKEFSMNLSSDQVNSILLKLIIPSMHWFRGLAFANIRVKASQCFLSILQSNRLEQSFLTGFLFDLIPPFTGSILNGEEYQAKVYGLLSAELIIISILEFLNQDENPNLGELLQILVDLCQSLIFLISDPKVDIKKKAIEILKQPLLFIFKLNSEILPRSNFEKKDQEEIKNGGESEERYRRINQPIDKPYVTNFKMVVKELITLKHDEEVAQLVDGVINEFIEVLPLKSKIKDLLVEESEFFNTFFPNSAVISELQDLVCL
ncbi:hypothetical protein P9112_005856 [Eukaryota sp. TZLM1-RC]